MSQSGGLNAVLPWKSSKLSTRFVDRKNCFPDPKKSGLRGLAVDTPDAVGRSRYSKTESEIAVSVKNVFCPNTG